MSSLPPRQHEWLVVIPDKPGTLQKRLDVRSKHIENIKPLVESGVIKKGGALLNQPDTGDASALDFHGSALIVSAESREAVVDLINKDIYAASGVWDVENAQIWPSKFVV
ncbi:hypothetical protein F4778DRAFT_782233 [Xylariomycetidae sp. FL2044]|nr:hypothetical protein F4778DRAFT_782233 [Xylariomycetidae sp. FL2044]